MVIYGIFIMAVGKAAMHRSYLYPHNPTFGALSQGRARFFCAKAGVALLFQHKVCWARELRSNTPCPGGKIFAEPQRRAALCGARKIAASAAGIKRKGHLRFPFLFELLPFPYLLARRKSESGDRFENGVRQRIFSSVGGGHWPPLSPPLRNARFPTATHTVYSTQARLIVPRNSLPRCRRRHLRIFLCEYALSDILSTLHSTAEFTHKKEPEAKASGSLRLCAYFIMISAMNTRSVSPVLSSA